MPLKTSKANKRKQNNGIFVLSFYNFKATLNTSQRTQALATSKRDILTRRLVSNLKTKEAERRFVTFHTELYEPCFNRLEACLDRPLLYVIISCGCLGLRSPVWILGEVLPLPVKTGQFVVLLYCFCTRAALYAHDLFAADVLDCHLVRALF